MSYLEKLNRFASNPVTMDMKRTKFNRSHSNTITLNSGLLVPIMFDEILPDDTVSLDVASVVRSITPAVPVMDNSYIDIYAFFVPNRIACLHDKDWQQVCGENINGFWANATEYTLDNTGNTADLHSSSQAVEPQCLADYLGVLPVGFNPAASGSPNFSRLPLNGYCLIWDEFFRDENLQSPTGWKSFTDSDVRRYYKVSSTLLPTCKLHDYFTSALPGLQKGASVLLPMAGSAPVKTDSTDIDVSSLPGLKLKHIVGGGVNSGVLSTDSNGILFESVAAGTIQGTALAPSNLYADLTAATAVSVNEMRQAFALQKLLEKDARGGWACA